MQVVLLVGDGDLNVRLRKGRGDGKHLGVDLANEDRLFARLLGHVLEGSNLGGNGSREKQGLALRGGRQHTQTLLHIWKHAARAGGMQESIRLIQNNEAHSPQATYRVLARCSDVICKATRRGNDNVRPLGQGNRLSAHVRSTSHEDGLETLR